MHIRPFTSEDYPALAAIHDSQGVVWPEAPATAAAWAMADQHRNPKCKSGRWLAEQDGQVVGFASYGQSLGDYHPQKFYINIEVLPARQRRGIGAALYDRLMESLTPFDPTVLRADAFANLPQGYPFLQKRGFVEVWRETPVHLDLAAFDPRPYAGLEEWLRRQGIQIHTLIGLAGDPDRDRKLFELYATIDGDLPCEPGPARRMAFEDWAWSLQDPTLLPEAYFVAVCGDRYIGLRELFRDSDGTSLLGSLLGILPEYRRRGLGLALQLRGIAYGREHGYQRLKTCTGKVNFRMQSLFDKLGFGRGPEWQQCQRNL